MTDQNITNQRPGFLSPLAVHAIASSPSNYQELVVCGPTPDSATKLLDGVTPEQLLTLPVKNSDDASALLAGAWLWLDGLHECHAIAQDLIGPTGAFWHAIMHRREGDFSNARYWYGRCQDHRARRLVSAMAMDVVGRHTRDKSILKIVAGEYNPEALVDLVQSVHQHPDDPRRGSAVRLQQVEWEALFYHCAYEATGEAGGMF